MPTARQDVGEAGEKLVVKTCPCPRCKRGGKLKRLPANFECADLICNFCGYLGQVKAKAGVKDVSVVPDTVLGAAWKPQKDRMADGAHRAAQRACLVPLTPEGAALVEHAPGVAEWLSRMQARSSYPGGLMHQGFEMCRTYAAPQNRL
jgi:hypothetical protein